MSIMSTNFPVVADELGGILVLLLGRAVYQVGQTVTVKQGRKRWDNYIVADLRSFKLHEAPGYVLEVLQLGNHDELLGLAQRANGTGLPKTAPLTLIRLASPLEYEAYRREIMRLYEEMTRIEHPGVEFLNIELIAAPPTDAETLRDAWLRWGDQELDVDVNHDSGDHAGGDGGDFE